MSIPIHEAKDNVREIDLTGLEEIARTSAARITIRTDDDLEKAKESIRYYHNHEVYFNLKGSKGYHHGKLKRIWGNSGERFPVQIQGSDITSGIQYEKLGDIIILG